MKKLLLLIGLLSPSCFAQTLSGFVKEKGSNEQLAGASVFCVETKTGANSNKYGFYSLALPRAKDSLTFVFSVVGYEAQTKRVSTKNNFILDIWLQPEATTLGEVVVKADAPKISQTARMSFQTVSIKQVQEIPALLGEKDIMKVLQLLPGIQRGNDGNGLIFVRGGASDQNLLLLDEAPVYNLFHAGGFFSIFNGNALKRFEVIKGAFPARFGGRLSSVIEVQTKDGNKEKVEGSVNMGLLSSNLLIEGPIQKNKSSFLFSGRMSYWDKFYDLVRPKKDDRILFGLYDYIAKLHFELSPKDKLYISNYFGRDNFTWTQGEGKRVPENADFYFNNLDFGLNWGNNTATARWNRVFSQKLFANTSLIFSQYDFRYHNNTATVNLKSKAETSDSSSYQAQIRDIGLKTDFDYFANAQHHLHFGGGYTQHRFLPEKIKLSNSSNNYRKDTLTVVMAAEYNAYMEDEWKPNEQLFINVGLRWAAFGVQDKSYSYLEPRLGFAYLLPNSWTLKGGYARMTQFAHLASNSGVGFPFDVWIPSTARIKPQQADQISVGLVKDIANRNIEISIEGFYKKMNNILALREGASFLSGNTLDIFKESLSWKQENWDEKMVQGVGQAHGIEALVQKKTGKLTGWVSYTFSRVQNTFAELNNGRAFYPRYDRRHNLSLVGIYHPNSRITISGTWSFASGQRLTVPASNFGAFNSSVWYGVNNTLANSTYEYTEYGNFKTPAYHRLDLNVQFKKNKKNNKAHIWELGIFNVYNRQNPFYYTFSETKPTQFQKVSFFPVIGSVSYNFKF
jgi:outer membrane receptor for ferrienterochelin and colicin